MEVVSPFSALPSSSLNPKAPIFVPTAFRLVEDYSEQWWSLVHSSPWFRDYWLQERFQDPELADPFFPEFEDTDIEALFDSYSVKQEEEHREKDYCEDLISLGGLKWRKSRSSAEAPRFVEKAPKFVNAKVTELGLGNHVVASKQALSLAKRYSTILKALKQRNPSSKKFKEATRLVMKILIALKRANFEGLPCAAPTKLPPGTIYEMNTLPVDAKAVVDGDGMTVYVDAADPRESANIPWEVQMAAVQRTEARANRNYAEADKLHQQIVEAGYRVLFIGKKEVLARKCRIRMRGIDALETKMAYGKEAQEALVEIVRGMSLRVFVYGEDHYGRIVGDIYCDGVFVQESMLKNGMAWHYAACDQRLELAAWQNDARAKRIGLWGLSNPEKPWDWRRKNPREK